jgi:hypothetical protein
MHRPSSFRLLLLALALVLGQWLSLAHDFQHPALKVDAACQICVHAQGLDGGALAPVVHLPSQFAIGEAPGTVAAMVASLAPQARIRIRGPPATAITPV